MSNIRDSMLFDSVRPPTRQTYCVSPTVNHDVSSQIFTIHHDSSLHADNNNNISILSLGGATYQI